MLSRSLCVVFYVINGRCPLSSNFPQDPDLANHGSFPHKSAEDQGIYVFKITYFCSDLLSRIVLRLKFLNSMFSA
jgi:hypothetical protein